MRFMKYKIIKSCIYDFWVNTKEEMNMIRDCIVAIACCAVSISAFAQEGDYPNRPSNPHDLEKSSLEHVFENFELSPPASEDEGPTVIGGEELRSGFEACVGAKGYQKVYGCLYEYEAYLTRGTCRARGGGWVPGTSVELRIRAPGHLTHTRSGSQYVNFNDKSYGTTCARACAAVTIYYAGSAYGNSRCNRRSYE